ncbi:MULTISPECIES: Pr6Pr family membrane protein [unclassified Caulobacter]|uniref:Pr6Pr family membrane protein n=1 Tax=unclassified Caulobacter TaxID=2648921 RepID=UPI000D3BF83F|nr:MULTISPECIES: Pr6Pr family membrane protein [unclassified Caulobacter]PTS82580.1 hypothetical protein DBR21_17210 [Caulobacter sp. HMWF009]PTT12250.1 hypothetical protein DBR10_01995 [Caulobacter sp. HMWF025]
MKAWRILIAAIAVTGPLLQYGLMLEGETLTSGIAKSVEFFSYFTIISNLLAAVVLTAPLVAPRSALALWCEQTPPRVATAVYLAITAGIYHTLLASQWDPQGWRLVSDTLLHTVTPALFLLDWLARGGVGPVVWRAVPKVLILPTAYGVWTLLHGALSGFYPYPFMNVAKRGYPAVLVTMVVMAIGFLVVAAVFTALHQTRARVAQRSREPLSA